MLDPYHQGTKTPFFRQGRRGFYLHRWLGALLTALLLLIGFFLVYNRLLADAAIGELEMSLSQVASAQSLNDLRFIRFYLDEAMAMELAVGRGDPERFTSLELSRNIALEAQDSRQVRDVQFMLQEVFKDRKKARMAWLKVLDGMVDWVRRWFGVGGQLRAPSTLVRKGRALTPEEKRIYLRAQRYEESWRLAEAVQVYEQLLREASDSKEAVDLQVDLSYATMKAGNHKEAESLLSRLRNQVRGSLEEGMVLTLLQKERTLQALSKERSALAAGLSKIESPEALQRAYIKLGLVYYRLFDLKGAEESYFAAASVIRDNAEAARALFYLGVTLKLHGKPKEARNVFEELRDRFPKSDYSLYGRYQMADSLRKAGDFEKAAEEFQSIAVNFAETPLAPLSQFRAGYVYFYDMGDALRAKEAFESLQDSFAGHRLARYVSNEMDPYIKSAVRDFGFVLLQKKLYSDARHALEEAVGLDPNDVWAVSGLATTLALLGEKKQAIEMARIAAELGPDGYTLAALGYVHELCGEILKAIVFYEKALQVRGDYPEVLYNLGRLYEFVGRYDDAIQAYRNVIGKTGKRERDAEAFINLGHVYWTRGHYLDAQAHFEKAIELDPNSVVAHYNMALAYRMSRRFDLARRQFQKVLKLDPEFRQAKVALALLEKRR